MLSTFYVCPCLPQGDPSPILCVHCSLPFPSSAAFAEHYVLVHGGGASPAALAAMAARTPSPSPVRDRDRDRERDRDRDRDHQQEKPTDLSVSRKTSSRRGDDKGMPPSKRSKANHEPPPLLLDGLMVSKESPSYILFQLFERLFLLLPLILF